MSRALNLVHKYKKKKIEKISVQHSILTFYGKYISKNIFVVFCFSVEGTCGNKVEAFGQKIFAKNYGLWWVPSGPTTGPRGPEGWRRPRKGPLGKKKLSQNFA